MSPRIATILFLLTATLGAEAAQPFNLEGEWQVRLISCLPTERECLSRRTDETHKVHTPMNLHERFPWFFGVAEYVRTFDHEGSKQPGEPIPDMLILGSIGSIDETYLNGVFVQREGIYDADAVVSAWNKVRVYHLPTGALRSGKNTLQIRVTVLDFKAGIHAGPLKLGFAPDLLPAAIGYQYLREYLFFGSPILTIVVVLVLLLTAKYWQRDEGNHYLILASAGYLLHGMYFMPVPFFSDHLFFLRLQWAGRIASIIFTTTYFLSNFEIRTRLVHAAWIAIGAVLVAIALNTHSHSELYATMQWQQWAFLAHLAFPFIYWKRMQTSPRREIYMQYVVAAVAVAACYINDALVLAYAVGSAWLYHYMSMLNVMNFLSHYSFHLYLWRHEGKLEGQRDAEVTHLRDKIEMAAELHDVVGAELSQMVVLSNASGNHAGALKQLAADSLEKVRNFAHILKGEKQVAELPEMLRNLRDRLLQLGRYEVVLIENNEDVFLRDVKGRNTNRQPQSETSTLVQLSPFARHEVANFAGAMDGVFTAFVRMHLERIFSEWSANVIRHAKEAKLLTLGWRLKRGRLSIFFVQDAASFAWKGHADRGGLKGIERRAQEIGATVVCRRFGQGSLLLLTMPLGRPNA